MVGNVNMIDMKKKSVINTEISRLLMDCKSGVIPFDDIVLILNSYGIYIVDSRGKEKVKINTSLPRAKYYIDVLDKGGILLNTLLVIEWCNDGGNFSMSSYLV